MSQLTKREEIASRFAAVICAGESAKMVASLDGRYDETNWKQIVAMNAIEFADELLSQLSSTEPKEEQSKSIKSKDCEICFSLADEYFGKTYDQRLKDEAIEYAHYVVSKLENKPEPKVESELTDEMIEKEARNYSVNVLTAKTFSDGARWARDFKPAPPDEIPRNESREDYQVQ